MKLTATFKGAGGSQGYENSKDYTLSFTTQNIPDKPYYDCIIVRLYGMSPGHPSVVVYGSFKKFTDNWEVK